MEGSAEKVFDRALQLLLSKIDLKMINSTSFSIFKNIKKKTFKNHTVKYSENSFIIVLATHSECTLY